MAIGHERWPAPGLRVRSAHRIHPAPRSSRDESASDTVRERRAVAPKGQAVVIRRELRRGIARRTRMSSDPPPGRRAAKDARSTHHDASPGRSPGLGAWLSPAFVSSTLEPGSHFRQTTGRGPGRTGEASLGDDLAEMGPAKRGSPTARHSSAVVARRYVMSPEPIGIPWGMPGRIDRTLRPPRGATTLRWEAGEIREPERDPACTCPG